MISKCFWHVEQAQTWNMGSKVVWLVMWRFSSAQEAHLAYLLPSFLPFHTRDGCAGQILRFENWVSFIGHLLSWHPDIFLIQYFP